MHWLVQGGGNKSLRDPQRAPTTPLERLLGNLSASSLVIIACEDCPDCSSQRTERCCGRTQVAVEVPPLNRGASISEIAGGAGLFLHPLRARECFFSRRAPPSDSISIPAGRIKLVSDCQRSPVAGGTVRCCSARIHSVIALDDIFDGLPLVGVACMIGGVPGGGSADLGGASPHAAAGRESPTAALLAAGGASLSSLGMLSPLAAGPSSRSVFEQVFGARASGALESSSDAAQAEAARSGEGDEGAWCREQAAFLACAAGTMAGTVAFRARSVWCEICSGLGSWFARAVGFCVGASKVLQPSNLFARFESSMFDGLCFAYRCNHVSEHEGGFHFYNCCDRVKRDKLLA